MEHTGRNRDRLTVRAAHDGRARPRLALAIAWLAAATPMTVSDLFAWNVQNLQAVRGGGPDGALAWSSVGAATDRAVVRADDDVFIIEPPVGIALREMWLESLHSAKERVACLGGYFDDRERAVHVTRVETVPARADSLRSEAGPSIEKCGPPMWSGTVHTHIALYRGQPYAMFSPNDRAVMGVWRSRWRTEGLFCVLYSEQLAYCEWGPALSADVAYNETPAPILAEQ